MNKIVWLLLLLFVGGVAQADGPSFETGDEARQRHNAERYQEFKNNNGMVPLGGYQDKFGDPAPLGTESPGTLPQKDPWASQPLGSAPRKR